MDYLKSTGNDFSDAEKSIFIFIKSEVILLEAVDKDDIWKDAIKRYLPLPLKRTMPQLYSDVNFSQEVKFLDKELQDTIQVTLAKEHNSAKFIDSLVELPLKSGKSQWILLHIEVQGAGGEDISYRMMLYCCLKFMIRTMINF